MPLQRSRQHHPFSGDFSGDRVHRFIIALSMVGAISALATTAQAGSAQPIAIRSRSVELHYRLTGAGPSAQVELWYTRDRAATWHQANINNHQSPVTFLAPAEGLYGFTLIVRDNDRISQPPPKTHELPQRWVLIDYTPPLAQWNHLEPADDFTKTRTLRLHWTAYDDHLTSRPISLWYQSSIDQAWHEIDKALPNTGRYDWQLPENLSGQITLKLMVHDEGGHTVERLLGPEPITRWLASWVTTAPASTAQNDPNNTTTRPANDALASAQTEPPISLADRREAEELYRKGSWYLVRDQYALAAERFREALERDPDMPAAMNDLAGIYYLQQDYDQALKLYEGVLARDGKHQLALRGAALAYLSQRKYAQSRDTWQRLLSVNDKDAAAWFDMGDVLFLMGDLTNAQAHWRQAAKVDHSATAIIQKARSRLERFGANPPSLTADASR